MDVGGSDKSHRSEAAQNIQKNTLDSLKDISKATFDSMKGVMGSGAKKVKSAAKDCSRIINNVWDKDNKIPQNMAKIIVLAPLALFQNAANYMKHKKEDFMPTSEEKLKKMDADFDKFRYGPNGFEKL